MGRFGQEDQVAPRKEKKDVLRVFQPRKGGLLPEGCMCRLVYRHQSFSDISNIFKSIQKNTSLAKEITRGPHNVKHISTAECVWVKVGVGWAF